MNVEGAVIVLPKCDVDVLLVFAHHLSKGSERDRNTPNAGGWIPTFRSSKSRQQSAIRSVARDCGDFVANRNVPVIGFDRIIISSKPQRLALDDDLDIALCVGALHGARN